MNNKTDAFDLPMASLRILSQWAADCAERALPHFEHRVPDDPRPRQAIAGARAFASGGRRTTELRRLSMAAYAAARETADPVASAAAQAACLAASSAYTHPLADARQTVHLLGPAAHAALALEAAEGEGVADAAIGIGNSGADAAFDIGNGETEGADGCGNDDLHGESATADDALVAWALACVPPEVSAILRQMPPRIPKKKRLDDFLARLDEGVRNKPHQEAGEGQPMEQDRIRHMIVEQTSAYPMRMKYVPESKTFIATEYPCLHAARGVDPPYGCRDMMNQGSGEAHMTRGIILFGSSGSGTTTIGREVARRLGFPHYDLDDYLWRKDTPLPFSATWPRDVLVQRLMADIAKHPHFVMSGSMDSYNAPFVPLFDLAVMISAPAELRVARVESREAAWFGARILPGGDMHENHRKFMDMITRYDTDGSPSRAVHERWAGTLPCKVLRLDGAQPVDGNAACIVGAYAQVSGMAAPCSPDAENG